MACGCAPNKEGAQFATASLQEPVPTARDPSRLICEDVENVVAGCSVSSSTSFRTCEEARPHLPHRHPTSQCAITRIRQRELIDTHRNGALRSSCCGEIQAVSRSDATRATAHPHAKVLSVTNNVDRFSMDVTMEKGDILNELERAKDRNDRLAPLFERQNRNVLNAVVEIQYLLGNGPTRVDPWLKQLNRRLEVALDPNLPLDVTKPGLSSSARAKAQAYFAGWRTRQTTGHDKNYAHLLSNELARMEKESGFTHQQAPWSWPWTTTKTTTPKVPYMVSVVSAKTFEFQLLNSQHWKDVGVSAMHGEYTHRIQWYVISAVRVVPAPAKIMSELAHYPPNGLNQSALWDCLFDRARSDASGDRILFR